MDRILHVGLNAPKDRGQLHGFARALREESVSLQLHVDTMDINKKLIEAVDGFRPDIIFLQIQGEGRVRTEVIEEISRVCPYIYNWTGDVRSKIPEWYYEVAPYVVTLFSNKKNVEDMRKDGYRADFLQIGYDHKIFKPTGPKLAAAPIVFMGNHYHQKFPNSDMRYKMAKVLTKKYGEEFGLFGGGYPPRMIKNARNIMLSQNTEASIYRGAEMAISFSHFNYEGYFSDRLLRIMGSGCLAITHPYPGVEEDFNNEEHLLVFKTKASRINTEAAYEDFKGLMSLVRHYRGKTYQKKARRIARQGEEFVRNNYTYNHMVRNIIELHREWRNKL